MQSSLDGQLEDRLLAIAREFETAGMTPLDIALQMVMATTSGPLYCERQYKRARALLLEAREALLEAKGIESAAWRREATAGRLESQAA